jgi:DNA-binding NarL/FixJ family response regulator
MITIVIVDDHPVVRAGMRAILNTSEDLVVLAEGTNGADALRLAIHYSPDVLVLDLNLPDANGLEVIRQLRQQKIATAILILTAYHDRQTIFNLLECGAVGYVLKDEALESLVRAVRAAARGESWLSPSIASQVVRRAIGQADSAAPSKTSRLTPSELQVLRLLAQGLDNQTIAQKLVVTRRTVQNHVSNIYGKLGVASRTEAMAYAIRHGLVHVSAAWGTTDVS